MNIYKNIVYILKILGNDNLTISLEQLFQIKIMKEEKWKRRERKERKQKDFVPDNRKSISLISRLALLPGKLKKIRRKNLR